MCLALGDKILMEFSTFGDRFLCVVTDLGADGRFFVYTPLPQPVAERLCRDRTARVLFAHEGILRGFDTRVLNEDNPPGVILKLAGPGAIYDAEERGEPRCRCRFPATVAGGAGAIRAVVEDMSASCARVRLLDSGWRTPAGPVGVEVCLTFHPFDLDEGHSVVCTVKKVFMKDSSQFMVLEFGCGDTAVRDRIARFVEAQVRFGQARL